MSKIWELPYNKHLPKRLRENGGRLSIPMPAGPRLLSHAFLEPPRTFFPKNIRANARVLASVTVEMADGTVWDPNPGKEVVNPSIPAQWGIVLCRNSESWGYEVNSRAFYTVRNELAPGTVSIEAPLDPSLWRGPFVPDLSKKKPLWRDIWKDECRLGICFGGQFYAHGISVISGYATIHINYLTLRT